jgi:hypothetical protein
LQIGQGTVSAGSAIFIQADALLDFEAFIEAMTALVGRCIRQHSFAVVTANSRNLPIAFSRPATEAFHNIEPSGYFSKMSYTWSTTRRL